MLSAHGLVMLDVLGSAKMHSNHKFTGHCIEKYFWDCTAKHNWNLSPFINKSRQSLGLSGMLLSHGIDILAVPKPVRVASIWEAVLMNIARNTW